MSSLPLKLADPGRSTPRENLAFERRGAERHCISGRATAVSTSADAEGPRNRIRSLELLNISDTGLGAISQDPIEPDTVITVFFPPHGADRGFDASGRVVRCRPFRYGHEVGIRFTSRPAA